MGLEPITRRDQQSQSRKERSKSCHTWLLFSLIAFATLLSTLTHGDHGAPPLAELSMPTPINIRQSVPPLPAPTHTTTPSRQHNSWNSSCFRIGATNRRHASAGFISNYRGHTRRQHVSTDAGGSNPGRRSAHHEGHHEHQEPYSDGINPISTSTTGGSKSIAATRAIDTPSSPTPTLNQVGVTHNSGPSDPRHVPQRAAPPSHRAAPPCMQLSNSIPSPTRWSVCHGSPHRTLQSGGAHPTIGGCAMDLPPQQLLALLPKAHHRAAALQGQDHSVAVSTSCA